MEKVETPRQVEQHYKKKKLVDTYIEDRFRNPLNFVEHKRQVFFLNKAIKKKNPKLALELAPGPARVTSEIFPCKGMSIDSSPEMVEAARKRMQRKYWEFKVGNAFKLGYKNKFDLIFAFRFFFHFKKEDRDRLYRQAHQALTNKGLLVFEVMNARKVKLIRRVIGKEKYFVYDKLYYKNEFIKEMEQNGFKVLSFYPVLNHFWSQALVSKSFSLSGLSSLAKSIISMLEFKSSNPYQWVAVCQKK